MNCGLVFFCFSFSCIFVVSIDFWCFLNVRMIEFLFLYWKCTNLYLFIWYGIHFLRLIEFAFFFFDFQHDCLIFLTSFCFVWLVLLLHLNFRVLTGKTGHLTGKALYHLKKRSLFPKQNIQKKKRLFPKQRPLTLRMQLTFLL